MAKRSRHSLDFELVKIPTFLTELRNFTLSLNTGRDLIVVDTADYNRHAGCAKLGR